MIKKIKIILKRYPYIASAYLFGSYIKGTAGPMSDLDIALLLTDTAPTGRELIHEEDYIAYKIEKALNIKNVDIIGLNRQRLVFQHNVLKTGRLFYDTNPAVRIKFVLKVISEFCDFEPTLRAIERIHVKGIIKRCESL